MEPCPTFSAQKVPHDVWICIFDWVTEVQCPLLESSEHSFLHHQSTYTTYGGWGKAAEEMRSPIRLVHVCRAWRSIYLRQAFSSIAIRGALGTKRLLQILESSRSIDGHGGLGLGRWVKHLFWWEDVQISTGVLDKTPFSNPFTALMQGLPNLITFTAQSYRFGVPSIIVDTMIKSPAVYTLRYFSAVGSAIDYVDLVEFLTKAPKVESLYLHHSTGRRLTPGPFTLPNLRTLHLEFSWYTCKTQEWFMSGHFPNLESLSIRSSRPWAWKVLNALLSLNGRTLKFFALRTVLHDSMPQPTYDLSNVAAFCPSLQYLIFDMNTSGLNALESLKSLRGIGIILRGQDPAETRRASTILTSLFNIDLPESVQTIVLFQLCLSSGSENDKIRQRFGKWLEECKERGIQVRGDQGKSISSFGHCLPSTGINE